MLEGEAVLCGFGETGAQGGYVAGFKAGTGDAQSLHNPRRRTCCFSKSETARR